MMEPRKRCLQCNEEQLFAWSGTELDLLLVDEASGLDLSADQIKIIEKRIADQKKADPYLRELRDQDYAPPFGGR